MPPYGNQVPGHPALRPVSTAYLLLRRKTHGHTQLVVHDGLKHQRNLRFHGWKMVPTETFVHFALWDIQKREVMIVTEDLLEVVNL